MRTTARRLLLGTAGVLMSACGGGSTTDVPDVPAGEPLLVITAVVVTDQGGLAGLVGIRNIGRGAFNGAVAGLCLPSLLLAMAPADPASVTHWDQHGWVASRPGSCKWAPLPLRIESGELATVRTPVTPPTEILGDSLPPGTYAAAVRVRLTEPRDSTFIVSAGDYADSEVARTGSARRLASCRRAAPGGPSASRAGRAVSEMCMASRHQPLMARCRESRA